MDGLQDYVSWLELSDLHAALPEVFPVVGNDTTASYPASSSADDHLSTGTGPSPAPSLHSQEENYPDV